ncbi:MAG: sirohydrochlorin cobaltochelatase, partial [Deltaproteobacteria bacterium]|nr:sirohydrochlorin cobaltochelatase [Deltaproteobacteria bacterium]
MRKIGFWLAAIMLFLAITPSPFAMGRAENKKAIVLASFGTSYPEALKGITGITREVVGAFPGIRVKMAFTSSIIREIWQERRGDKEFFREHEDIPR